MHTILGKITSSNTIDGLVDQPCMCPLTSPSSALWVLDNARSVIMLWALLGFPTAARGSYSKSRHYAGCAGNLLRLPVTKCHHPNLLQTNIWGYCLLEKRRISSSPAYILVPGRLGIQPKTYLWMWTAELIPLGDEFQIPGRDCGIGPE